MPVDKSKRKSELGIAFSGGGLQGIAHIGAVKALYELGIVPQYVAGTSSGSAMAALVAMGYTAEEMYAFADKNWKQIADFKTGDLLRQLAGLRFNKKTEKDGLRDGKMIADIIKEAMDTKGIRGFRDLPINLTVCTNDTNTTDEVIFTTWEEDLRREHIHYLTGAPLELAVRASMSFPALFTTCDYEGYNFIDGGSKDNLPVQVLRDMGVGKVLAIGFDISEYTPAKGLDGLMKVIWRALDLYSIDRTRESKRMADYCVDIKNSATAIFSMDNIDLTIQEGYDCVMKHREALKAFVTR